MVSTEIDISLNKIGRGNKLNWNDVSQFNKHLFCQLRLFGLWTFFQEVSRGNILGGNNIDAIKTYTSLVSTQITTICDSLFLLFLIINLKKYIIFVEKK